MHGIVLSALKCSRRKSKVLFWKLKLSMWSRNNRDRFWGPAKAAWVEFHSDDVRCESNFHIPEKPWMLNWCFNMNLTVVRSTPPAAVPVRASCCHKSIECSTHRRTTFLKLTRKVGIIIIYPLQMVPESGIHGDTWKCTWKCRSQTSDNMDRWKAEVGRVREEKKTSEKIREERRCRCAER